MSSIEGTARAFDEAAKKTDPKPLTMMDIFHKAAEVVTGKIQKETIIDGLDTIKTIVASSSEEDVEQDVSKTMEEKDLKEKKVLL